MIMIMRKELVVDDDYHEQPRLQVFPLEDGRGGKVL